ncbi:MAG: hypothetical protein JXX29_01775 [Deltaproteobacteria bacterium]|nr:hypothetical protein [Deltaproteobacteria bacterium]MBN2670369.1 hypothetical protein [Deltaproteobacteria bacterium]
MTTRVFKLQIIIVSLFLAAPGVRAEFFAAGELETNFISNTYLDDSKEWDLMVRPLGTVECELPAEMAVGYVGAAELYVRHTQLLFHEHELYWLLNPYFGAEEQHNWLLGVQIQAQKSTDNFRMVNLISPLLELSLSMEPLYWWYIEIGATEEYRWYPNDSASDSFDTWGLLSTTLSSPSRTSLTLRFALGYRYYIHPVYLVEEPTDQQLKTGARIAQGITENTGLWVDYEYQYAFDENNIVLQQVDNVELNVVGESFLYSGHQVKGGMKHVTPGFGELSLELGYQNRTYAGIDVLDIDGLYTGETRVDDRVWGRVGARFEKEADSVSSLLLAMDISYRYMRQLSNDAWLDTDQHWVTLRFSIEH